MLDQLLNTAHIHLQHATFYVYVNDLKCYEALFTPVGICKEDILEISNDWKKEMGFPDFVIDISPRWEEGCLLVWVTEGYDINELNKWLKTFDNLK